MAPRDAATIVSSTPSGKMTPHGGSAKQGTDGAGPTTRKALIRPVHGGSADAHGHSKVTTQVLRTGPVQATISATTMAVVTHGITPTPPNGREPATTAAGGSQVAKSPVKECGETSRSRLVRAGGVADALSQIPIRKTNYGLRL